MANTTNLMSIVPNQAAPTTTRTTSQGAQPRYRQTPRQGRKNFGATFDKLNAKLDEVKQGVQDLQDTGKKLAQVEGDAKPLSEQETAQGMSETPQDAPQQDEILSAVEKKLSTPADKLKDTTPPPNEEIQTADIFFGDNTKLKVQPQIETEQQPTETTKSTEPTEPTKTTESIEPTETIEPIESTELIVRTAQTVALTPIIAIASTTELDATKEVDAPDTVESSRDIPLDKPKVRGAKNFSVRNLLWQRVLNVPTTPDTEKILPVDTLTNTTPADKIDVQPTPPANSNLNYFFAMNSETLLTNPREIPVTLPTAEVQPIDAVKNVTPAQNLMTLVPQSDSNAQSMLNLLGGKSWRLIETPQVQVQAQPVEIQPQIQVQAQPTEIQPQVQTQAAEIQPQIQVQAQPVNVQPQVQTQAQPVNVQLQVQTQAQPAEIQPQVQLQTQPVNVQPQIQVQTQAQPAEIQPQVQVQAQPAEIQPQVQAQPVEIQPQVQVQAQPVDVQPQVQTQVQPAEIQPQVQIQAQPAEIQPQVQIQAQPVEIQPQVQVQAQPVEIQPQVQAQPVEIQPQVQAQPVNVQPEVQAEIQATQPVIQQRIDVQPAQILSDMLGVNVQVEDAPISAPVTAPQATTQQFDQETPQRDAQQNFQGQTFTAPTETQAQPVSTGGEIFSVPLTTNDTTPTQQTAPTQVPDVPPQTPEDFDVPAQIVRQARLIRTAENTQMVIKLNPEHLGELTLKISVSSGGAINASFHSDNAQVRTIIENSLVQLRQELNNQGLKVENVQVYAGLSEDGGLMNGQGGQAWQQNRQQRQGNRRINIETLERDIDSSTPVNENSVAEGVDYSV